MANYKEADLFDYKFSGEMAPQPFPKEKVYQYSIEGETGQGTIESFVLGQMPHKLKDGSDDAEKVRRKGNIVLLSEDKSEIHVIDFDCLYPCDSSTSILDIKCIVSEVGQA